MLVETERLTITEFTPAMAQVVRENAALRIFLPESVYIKVPTGKS